MLRGQAGREDGTRSPHRWLGSVRPRLSHPRAMLLPIDATRGAHMRHARSTQPRVRAPIWLHGTESAAKCGSRELVNPTLCNRAGHAGGGRAATWRRWPTRSSASPLPLQRPDAMPNPIRETVTAVNSGYRINPDLGRRGYLHRRLSLPWFASEGVARAGKCTASASGPTGPPRHRPSDQGHPDLRPLFEL